MSIADLFAQVAQSKQNPPAGLPAPSVPTVPLMGATNPLAQVAMSEGRFSTIYVLPGVYPLLYVNTVKMGTNKDDYPVWIVEIDILQSDVPSRPAGSNMTWIVNFRHKATAGAVKSFTAALLNAPLGGITEPLLAKIVAADNPTHGRLIRCEATEVITRDNKKPFTSCNWRAIPDEIQDQAEALRKAAGFI